LDAWGRFDAAAFVREVQERAARPLSELTDYPFWTQPHKVPDATIAQALLHSYLAARPGELSVWPAPPDRVAVNCNEDPELPRPSRASLWFDYEGVPALTDPRVDGAYLDSVGWGAFDVAENSRPDHWATADLPLVPSFRAEGPVQLAAFAHYELYQAIAAAMHRRGKLILANTFPWAATFCAHLLDVLGAGEAADLEAFHDLTRLSFHRVLAFRKPVSHMNYAYLKPEVSLQAKERALQRTLLYAVWPGTGDGGKLEAIEALRPLLAKYLPLFRTLTAAGWQPITLAHAQPESVLVERYGSPCQGVVYFAVHNPTFAAVEARVLIGSTLRLAGHVRHLKDLVSGSKVPVRRQQVGFALAPFQTRVLAVPLR
jgi:hypothetical protein